MGDPTMADRDPITLADANYLSDEVGYLALPTSGEGPGILVLTEGVDGGSVARSVSDRLAREGYIALAPGFGPESPGEGTRSRSPPTATDPDRQLSLAMRAVDRLAQLKGVVGDGIGVVGIGERAATAMLLAELKPVRVRAVVVFYGFEPEVHFDATRAAFQGHFAGDDPELDEPDWRSLEGAIRSGGREAVFHSYPGVGPGFFEPGQPNHDVDAEISAWARMLDFLRDRLGQS